VLVVVGLGIAGQQPGKDQSDAALKQKLAAADLVVVGKVTQTGLSAASSFDVGVIEVGEVLRGDKAVKTANFRFTSTGSGKVAPYGKKGVEGVWILGKKGAYMEAREVLQYLPAEEAKNVKDLIAKAGAEKEDKKDR
jgi:hypothetical protein